MPEQNTRRQFLAQAALGVAALAAGDAVNAAAKEPLIPIIDTHQHLWDLRYFRPPWLNDVPQLNKQHGLAEYRRAARGLNIVKTVYMEVDVDPKQQEEEAEYVIKLCKDSRKSGMYGAVISGRPLDPGFESYIRRFADNPYIKGLRQVLHVPSTPRGYCNHPTYVKSVRLLGDLGLSFDLVMRNDELDEAAKLVSACPKTRFVLDHCGNGDCTQQDRSVWERGMREIAKRENVVCKLSGVISRLRPTDADKARRLEPIVRHTIDCFGIDRVFFASDWPVCTLGGSMSEWVDALKWIVRDFSPEDQRKIFHDNAARYYRI